MKPTATQQLTQQLSAVRPIAKDSTCGGCYIVLFNKEQPDTFTYLCGQRLLRHRPTCSPCGCKKHCSSAAQLVPVPVPNPPEPEPEPDDGYWLPDSIITGPRAEVELRYRTRERLSQSIRIPPARELLPERLSISEVDSLEVRCTPNGTEKK
ncbi:MAG TPA: hypothetical protein VEY88_21450, partial [Archangium sp.]|nr:hypothetical protein [Archangium sp.]